MIDFIIRLILGPSRYHTMVNDMTSTKGRTALARRHALQLRVEATLLVGRRDEVKR